MREIIKFEPSRDHIFHCAIFEFHKGSNSVKATNNICEVYGEGVLKERTCRSWFSKFRSGVFELKKKDISKRKKKYDSGSIKEVLDENQFLTVREISIRTNIPRSTVFEYLQELGKVNKLGSYIPHFLTENQKNQRIEACKKLLSLLNKEFFFDQIITGDEKWVLYDNVVRKRQWINKDEKPKPTSKKNSKKKIMLSVFWDLKGIIFFEFLNSNETINSEFYSNQLIELNENLIKKRPSLVNRKKIFLLHDNEKPHISKTTKETISDLEWEILPHPPYSPDLAPTDFYLFRHLQNSLREKKFNKDEDIKNHIKHFFDSKEKSFFEKGIKKLEEKWRKAIDAEGDYFDF